MHDLSRGKSIIVFRLPLHMEAAKKAKRGRLTQWYVKKLEYFINHRKRAMLASLGMGNGSLKVGIHADAPAAHLRLESFAKYSVQTGLSADGAQHRFALRLTRHFFCGVADSQTMVIGKTRAFPASLLYPTNNLTAAIAADMPGRDAK